MSDPIPRTRAEALKAGLRTFTPFKPCKRGHISERHVVKGCQQCRREVGKRADAARILNGKWAESLEAAIETARASQDFGLYPVTALVPSSHLALVIAHFVTRPRLNKKAPSVLTVAEELGRALNVPEDLWRHDGAMLLGVAEACGFILPLDNQQRINGRYLQSEVRLSPEAYRQRADIEERLAGEDIDSESRPVPDVPGVRVTIRPNIKASEPEAPLPEPIESVAAALAPIQSTAWRVNPFMYRTLRALAAHVSLDIEKDRHTGAIGALEQAGYWSQLPRFYYRCRFDWRGRLYQLGGRLQYTSGADAARALLEFADGEPLTADGRDWLAVHVATCFGLKGSYADRIAWTLKHSEEILAAVRDPIGSWGRWSRAKEPYQFLAACDAWRQHTDNPDAPIHLPIAADATSSILQHYALLMRDIELGAKVNLMDAPISTTPADFYGDLAKGYRRPIRVTKNDDTFDTERVLVPLLRDQVKQAIWFFYGQTSDSLAEELGSKQFARGMRSLLHKHALGAWKLRQRLRTVARRFAVSGLPIAWTMPDGFRVYQAYRQSKTMMAPIPLWSWKGVWYLKPRARRLLAEFSTKKQVNSLPANLIHSFDACLLREIVRQAPTVTRWAVAHDSVGVHPSDRTAMHEAAQRAIAWLYAPDRLAELWQQWGAVADRKLRHPHDLPAQMGSGWYTFS